MICSRLGRPDQTIENSGPFSGLGNMIFSCTKETSLLMLLLFNLQVRDMTWLGMAAALLLLLVWRSRKEKFNLASMNSLQESTFSNIFVCLLPLCLSLLFLETRAGQKKIYAWCSPLHTQFQSQLPNKSSPTDVNSALCNFFHTCFWVMFPLELVGAVRLHLLHLRWSISIFSAWGLQTLCLEWSGWNRPWTFFEVSWYNIPDLNWAASHLMLIWGSQGGVSFPHSISQPREKVSSPHLTTSLGWETPHPFCCFPQGI